MKIQNWFVYHVGDQTLKVNISFKRQWHINHFFYLTKIFKVPLLMQMCYTARAPIVCTSVIIELKDNYLLQSRPMITG